MRLWVPLGLGSFLAELCPHRRCDVSMIVEGMGPDKKRRF